jgi:hypothetical protein
MSTKTEVGEIMAFIFLGTIAVYGFYRTLQERITSLENQLNTYHKEIAQLDMIITQVREHNVALEKHVYELNVATATKQCVEIDTQTVRHIYVSCDTQMSPSTTFTEDTLSVSSDTVLVNSVNPSKRYLWPFNVVY